MRGIDVLMCFPDLILAVAVTAVLGANLTNLILTIGIVMTPRFARLAHGALLSIKERDYVTAAQAIGANVPRILRKHILPNIFGELLVAGTLWVGEAIRLEANLAFIGLGVQPPTPTWGNMTREGVDVLINAPGISMYAGLSILITILSFNMLGDGVRDMIDPRLWGICYSALISRSVLRIPNLVPACPSWESPRERHLAGNQAPENLLLPRRGDFPGR